MPITTMGPATRGSTGSTSGGTQGPPGPGVAPGGTAGQILSKVDNVDYNTTWVDAPTGGGGGLDLITADARYVNANGDTVTGQLVTQTIDANSWIKVNNSNLIVDRSVDTNEASIAGMINFVDRWRIHPGKGAEGPSNAGSDFVIDRYDNNGSIIPGTPPLTISRQTGLINVSGDPTWDYGVATKHYVDTNTVGRLPVGGTAGQILSKIDGTNFNTQWIAAPSGGGSVDWSNVPQFTLKPTAANAGIRLFDLNSKDNGTIYGYGNQLYLTAKDAGGTSQPGCTLVLNPGTSNYRGTIGMVGTGSTVFQGSGFASGTDNTPHVSMDGTGVHFGTGSAATDTDITRASTGVLNINGKAIQTAALRSDGTEAGLQDLLDEVTALRAEVAELRAGR